MARQSTFAIIMMVLVAMVVGGILYAIIAGATTQFVPVKVVEYAIPVPSGRYPGPSGGSWGPNRHHWHHRGHH